MARTHHAREQRHSPLTPPDRRRASVGEGGHGGRSEAVHPASDPWDRVERGREPGADGAGSRSRSRRAGGANWSARSSRSPGVGQPVCASTSASARSTRCLVFPPTQARRTGCARAAPPVRAPAGSRARRPRRTRNRGLIAGRRPPRGRRDRTLQRHFPTREELDETVLRHRRRCHASGNQAGQLIAFRTGSPFSFLEPIRTRRPAWTGPPSAPPSTSSWHVSVTDRGTVPARRGRRRHRWRDPQAGTSPAALREGREPGPTPCTEGRGRVQHQGGDSVEAAKRRL